MATEIKLGKVAGLSLSAMPSAIAGMALLWILLSAFAIGLLSLSPIEAIAGGLIAVALHGISEFLHQWGHARAARRLGHPMVGLRFWGLLSTSLYPADEPALPADIHIRRALGGPITSLVCSVVAAVITLALRPLGGTPWLIAAFVFLDNLFVLGLGSFLPLGFTDGSTLLHWWGKR